MIVTSQQREHFTNNSAINGGGLILDNQNLVRIDGSAFYSNTARDRGGAVAVRWQSTMFISESNNFGNNTAKWGKDW